MRSSLSGFSCIHRLHIQAGSPIMLQKGFRTYSLFHSSTVGSIKGFTGSRWLWLDHLACLKQSWCSASRRGVAWCRSVSAARAEENQGVEPGWGGAVLMLGSKNTMYPVSLLPDIWGRAFLSCVPMNHLGIPLKCRIWWIRPALGPEIPYF